MNKHEEKHKIDVKENEKSGEMRDLLPQNRGCGAKNRGCGYSKKKAHPLWMHFAKPDQIHNTKSG